MISSNAVASTASGLVLILIAGIFNGSWNASFSPRANLAVGRLQPKHKSDSKELDLQKGTAPSVSESPLSTDLTYHHAFALFQFYAALINIPICIFWAGGIERVDAILRQTPAASITLVILFSILWGFGTLLFGLACRIAGVGLGTNLSMGLIAVLGTFLPLLTEQTLFTNVGGVICLGLSVCCVGLAFATMALAKRDQDEHRVMILLRSSNKKDVNEIVECNLRKTGDGDDVELAGKLKDEVTIPSSKVNNDGNDSDNIYNDNATGSEGTYKTWQKVLVCVATAVFATQLQFAFIFGAPIVDLALNRNNDTNENEDGVMLLPGSTPASGGAAIIWLFAICLGSPVSILHGLISSPVSISHSLKVTPWWRHLRLIVSTTLPWVAHIHLYGVCATTFLPERVAASIGWPLLIISTGGQALVLSMFLGEWKDASDDTLRTLKLSLGITVLGLGVLMSSVAVA